MVGFGHNPGYLGGYTVYMNEGIWPPLGSLTSSHDAFMPHMRLIYDQISSIWGLFDHNYGQIHGKSMQI